jgi:hypothetical protein
MGSSFTSIMLCPRIRLCSVTTATSPISFHVIRLSGLRESTVHAAGWCLRIVFNGPQVLLMSTFKFSVHCSSAIIIVKGIFRTNFCKESRIWLSTLVKGTYMSSGHIAICSVPPMHRQLSELHSYLQRGRRQYDVSRTLSWHSGRS